MSQENASVAKAMIHTSHLNTDTFKKKILNKVGEATLCNVLHM